MARKIGDAFVSVLPQVATGFGKQLERGVIKESSAAGKKAGTGFSDGFKTTIKAVGTSFAALGVFDFLKGSLAEAKESIQVGAQTTAVIKSTGGAARVSAKQVGDLANAISLKTGVDDEAIQSNENLLLTFTNIRNEVGKGNDIFNQATQAVSDMSAALGQDGKSSAIQLGKALNDPIKGITALQRVGVSFTAQQKEAIATDIKRGNTLAAQKIILGEITKEFGGSAAAIATPGEKMNVAWKNLQETVGLKLVPVITKLATVLIPVISFIAGNLAVFASLAGFILAVVSAVKLWNLVQLILNAELTANPIGIIIVAIGALVAAIYLVATKTRFFQTVWAAVWGGIKSAFGATVQFIRNLIASIVDTFLAMVGAIIHGAAKAFGWVPGIGGKLKSAAKAFDAFRAQVNESLRGIHDRTVTVKVQYLGANKIQAGLLHGVGVMAEGGIVKARPGGTLKILGEAGQDEMVVPLRNGAPTGGGGSGGSGGAFDDLLAELQAIREAVERVAPGVGRALTGASAGTLVQARAR